MSSAGTRDDTALTGKRIREITAKLSTGAALRTTLPGAGQLHIDRPLPFLCVHRRDADPEGDGTERLITTEAAYIVGPGSAQHRPALARLVTAIARQGSTEFGGFLVLELWSGPPDEGDTHTPRFRICAPKSKTLAPFVDEFEGILARTRVRSVRARVDVEPVTGTGPQRHPFLLSAPTARKAGAFALGLEVAPIFRDASTGQLFPLVLRDLRRELTRALRRAFFEFARTHTTHRPRHFHVLGRRAMVKAVWQTDHQLADVSASFDLLLQVTPVNAPDAWQTFRRGRFQRPPVFRYRPLPVDPVLLKRSLYAVPVDRVEDPALFYLFREKQDELDRQITLLGDLNTDRFRWGSMQLYGEIDAPLLELAGQILDVLPAKAREGGRRPLVDAATFAERARAEIAFLQQQLPGLRVTIQVRSDVANGLMVSQGSLLIGSGSRIPEARVDALIQHEIGTHVLTYWNGGAQPFRQLQAGLAGYDSFQEGLAVLAEYLVGGLSRARLRLLAARVIAARSMAAGADFIETFRELHDEHGLTKATAFTVAMRVHRGGGLIKDAVYLRGLVQVVEHLHRGGRLDTLYTGKFAAHHLPIIRELQWRGVLHEAPLTPRFLSEPAALARLERVRNGASVLDLAQGR